MNVKLKTLPVIPIVSIDFFVNSDSIFTITNRFVMRIKFNPHLPKNLQKKVAIKINRNLNNINPIIISILKYFKGNFISGFILTSDRSVIK